MWEGRRVKLLGRRAECEELDRLLTEARAGHSRVVVLRGEAGVGKSALLGYLSGRVDDWHVARAVGIESEMELAYSGLHQLCAPMLDCLERLPRPQRDALATVFGRSAGLAPDRFFVSLATLTLFAEVAEGQPLVCIVDDAQWLDHASAQILGFVARRLLAERVAIVCAVRTTTGEDFLTGLPELPIRGLGAHDARALLLENMYGPLDAAVRDQIIKESHGNPLALIELPRAWRAVGVAGGFGHPGAQPVMSKIEASFARRLLLLPADTLLLVLAAAAEPLGDPVLLHRAAMALDLEPTAAAPAVDAGLLTIGGRVEFAHPLVRSAAYRMAGAADRLRVHHALAEATDAETDPDRRAWHRARATPASDEAVAAELERSASRAQARGGAAAAAAFLERAVELTPDPSRRATRALAAAQAASTAGNLDAAEALLAFADAGPLDDLSQARSQRLRAELAFDLRRGRDAPPLLLGAAQRLETLDAELACETYLEALVAALYAGRHAVGYDITDIAHAALATPFGIKPRSPKELLLVGLATRFTDGSAAAAPTLKKALRMYRGEAARLDWSCLAFNVAAMDLWDDEAWFELVSAQARQARATGTLSYMAFALSYLAGHHTLAGDLSQAAGLLAESQRLDLDTGNRQKNVPYGSLQLAAWRGEEAAALGFREVLTRGAEERGEGAAATVAEYATAVLYNGLGQYDLAREAALDAAATDEISTSSWALWELVEAAARSGAPEVATAALDRLVERTGASGHRLGARRRGALARTPRPRARQPKSLHLQAIDHLARCRIGLHLTRARLDLRRVAASREQTRRRAPAAQVRAFNSFTSMGAFGLRRTGSPRAGRHRREGAQAERRNARRPHRRRKEQIARLARDGLSNAEIGAQLFISARTVEWHLHKVFAKLGITSRKALAAALPRLEREATLA